MINNKNNKNNKYNKNKRNMSKQYQNEIIHSYNQSP